MTPAIRVALSVLFSMFLGLSVALAAPYVQAPSLVQVDEALLKLAQAHYLPGKQTSLPANPVDWPKAGEKNTWGVIVDENLHDAYTAYSNGNGLAALAALDRFDMGKANKNVDLHRWYSQFYRAQVFVMMGRSADVQVLLNKTRILEEILFSSTLQSDALQGEALVRLGDYDQAKQFFLRVAMALKDWRLPTEFAAAPDSHLLACNTTAQLRTYTGLAEIALMNGQNELAKAWAEKADTYYSDLHYMGNHRVYGQYLAVHADSYYGRALNLTYLGAAKDIQAQNFDISSQFFKQADAFYSAMSYKPGLASSRAFQAYASLQGGDIKRAAQLGEQAVQMANAIGLPDLIWRVQTLMGEAYLRNGQMELAEKSLRNAQAAVDLVNGSLATDRAKLQFGVGKSAITQRLMEFDLAANDTEQLFEDAERGRARAFVDLLTDTELALTDDSETNQLVRTLDQNIRNLRLQLGLQGNLEAGSTQKKIEQLMRSRNLLMDKLAAVNTEWSAAYTVRYATLAQIQEKLVSDEMLVYSFSTTKTQDIHLMFVSANGAQFKQIPAGHNAVNSALLALTDGVALSETHLQTTALDQLAKALDLANWPKAQKVYLVPSGQLHFVPWAALNTGQWVSLLPNGSWLLRPANRLAENANYLVVGDPDFAGELPQLPGARQEAERVSDLYKAQPLLGKQATSELIQSLSQKKLAVLHLATHGVFDHRKPLQSALYFSARNGGAKAVTAEDVFREPMRADLVVLSACETGVGQVQADNDILGLLRSFYMNGASQMVSTLWPVSDQGVQEFMSVFHANMQLGTGEALARAIAASREAGLPPSVYAAFVLHGYTHKAAVP